MNWFAITFQIMVVPLCLIYIFKPTWHSKLGLDIPDKLNEKAKEAGIYLLGMDAVVSWMTITNHFGFHPALAPLILAILGAGWWLSKSRKKK
jgi:hypothetical protein